MRDTWWDFKQDQYFYLSFLCLYLQDHSSNKMKWITKKPAALHCLQSCQRSLIKHCWPIYKAFFTPRQYFIYHWQHFGTQPILISALQWPNKTCYVPTWLYRVDKTPSVKTDLVIYSHAVDASGQCMSESLILGHNLDFSSCDILVSFCKSSHNY